ncbi:uncharacterized protein LOC117285687 [Fukomys damarensis]|uniref:uncharacterized protein LOC117285687 n=1 Tax=Fukomys damarensis TaxID=885580 RepID=UPI001455003B|nr:uncharacterized protein LOC117285687 [Fukomys damarensis]
MGVGGRAWSRTAFSLQHTPTWSLGPQGPRPACTFPDPTIRPASRVSGITYLFVSKLIHYPSYVFAVVNSPTLTSTRRATHLPSRRPTHHAWTQSPARPSVCPPRPPAIPPATDSLHFRANSNSQMPTRVTIACQTLCQALRLASEGDRPGVYLCASPASHFWDQVRSSSQRSQGFLTPARRELGPVLSAAVGSWTARPSVCLADDLPWSREQHCAQGRRALQNPNRLHPILTYRATSAPCLLQPTTTQAGSGAGDRESSRSPLGTRVFLLISQWVPFWVPFWVPSLPSGCPERFGVRLSNK